MKSHRTIACRLWLRVVLAAFGSLLPAGASASVTSDWAGRLALATSVSHEGYADSTFAQRAQDSAIAMARVILSDIEIHDAADSSAQAEVLTALGDYSFRKCEYRDAVSYWTRAAATSDPATTDISLRLCLPVIAGHRESLEPSSTTAAEARYSHLLKQCPSDSLFQLWTLAHLCENMWLMGEARLLHERVIAVHDAHAAADSRWAIRSLVTLGEMTSKRVGIPHVTNPSTLQDSAVALAERALELARTQFGTSDTMFAYVADRLGDYYSRIGRRAAAHALWDTAWAANRLHLPPEHIEYQGNLDRMASVFRSQGRYIEAETLAKQALELRKQTRGEGHPEVAYMYGNLGRVYHVTGKFHQAEECYRAALRIREQAIERSAPLIAESYRQLGQLYFDDGRYAAADRHFRRAIDLMTGALGEQHSWVAACMRDLSAMYTTWGRPEESIEKLREALAIQKRFLGDSHPALSSTLEEVARTELLLGHSAEASLAINQAAEIDRATVSAGGVSQRPIITTKARVLLASGFPASAESLLIQVIDQRDGRHPNVLALEDLTLLAQAQAGQGKLQQARATYDRVFTQPSVLHGLSTVSVADARDQFALFLLERREYGRALEVSVTALKQRLEILDQGGQVLSERQALQFEHAMHRSRNIMLTAFLAASDYRTVDRLDISDLLLASKGAISNSIFERERGLRRSIAPDISALRDSLHFTRHWLASMYLRGLADTNASRYQDVLDSLRETKDRLEQRLARHPEVGSAPDFARPDMSEAVRQSLPDQATLVEFFRYQAAGTEGNDQYAALVLPDSGRIVVQNLGDAREIDSLMQMYESQMTMASHTGLSPDAGDLATYRDIAEALYSRMWGPIAPGLSRDGAVIIAPDAELYLLSFAGLIDANGRYLIENRPVHYLSCGRDLLRNTQDPSIDGALLLCDPDFDADGETRAQAERATAQLVLGTVPPQEFVTLRSSCSLFADRQFVRLPGTREEVETVRLQLSARSIGSVEVRSGSAASEEYLKSHAGQRRLLHLATHGFFLSESCGKRVDQHVDGRFASLVGENPLLLSGLCLAGANVDQDSVAEDGILTAEEVASLPLDGTQWVVLSACDTRLGETKHGEGVFGLQRAFQMAGANTVISALWSIPDRATTSFMRSLYSHSKATLYNAMRQSQLAAIAELRKRGQPDHPYNWGAFVAVGSWRPLD